MNDFSLEITLDNIKQSANNFLAKVKGYKHFAFYGEMGVGKTSFITALCASLKAIDLVSSPTFSIINEYETETGDLIYHFDFYRINEPEELFDIGFEEYISTNNWCFIEWPEKGEALIPDSFLKVRINVDESGKRILQFEK